LQQLRRDADVKSDKLADLCVSLREMEERAARAESEVESLRSGADAVAEAAHKRREELAVVEGRLEEQRISLEGAQAQLGQERAACSEVEKKLQEGLATLEGVRTLLE
jgi:chromosome segregation ATPase